MPSLIRRWQNGWFYLRNDGGLLPEYTGKMVVECPAKWGWGAPAEEQRRLDALLEKLRRVSVAVAFHKRSLLPLAQRNMFMWEMTRETPWVGVRMLETPVPASEITTWVSRTTHSDLKDSRVVSMRPEKGYISLVRCRFFLHSRACFISSSL